MVTRSQKFHPQKTSGFRRLNIGACLRKLIVIACLSLFASSVFADVSETDLSGMTLAKDEKNLKIYVKPGTDVSGYSNFLLQSVDVAFDAKWLKRFNRDQNSLADRLTERQIAEITGRVENKFKSTLAKTLKSEGQATLTETASDNTLKVETSIVNLRMNAPDPMSGTNKITMVRQVGEAELHTKMYDANTGELVMVIIDSKETRDHFELIETNRIRNQFEFNTVYRAWARNWLVGLSQKS